MLRLENQQRNRGLKEPPSPIAIEPAATSAIPAITMMLLESTAPLNPAANANGTVNPSLMPITTRLTGRYRLNVVPDDRDEDEYPYRR